MLRVNGKQVLRGSEKIGWVDDQHVYAHNGEKVGYFEGNNIYTHDGKRVGYIEDHYIKTSDGKSIRLDDNRRHISGGALSDHERAAIRLLLGE